MMSSAQEKYVHSLKQIKEAEEKTLIEIEETKKKISEELKNFQINADAAIVKAKTDSKKFVETSIEQAQKKTAVETEKIINEAKNNVATISTKMDAKKIREIIDILLKGV